MFCMIDKVVDDGVQEKSSNDKNRSPKINKKGKGSPKQKGRGSEVKQNDDVSENEPDSSEATDGGSCPSPNGPIGDGFKEKTMGVNGIREDGLRKQNCAQEDESSTSESHSSDDLEHFTTSWFSGDSNPPTFTFEVDALALVMFLIAVTTRMYRLEEPRGIVFDELHYGKFAILYMKRTFFFDGHPPLGKQLIALAGYLAGFDGNVQFDRIGSKYPNGFPVWSLRAVPAFFGSLLVPVVYHLIVELGLTHKTAVLAAVLVILENSLLTQSRFILMESMLLFFSFYGILALLKFRKLKNKPFSPSWWFWLFMMGSSLTCAICVKYIGFFSAVLAGTIITWDYWHMIADKTISDKKLVLHFFARFLMLVAVPVCLYLLTFYIHLNLLTKAGPHDNIMTSAFQASLEGGLASITKGQPLEISHGSQITLRHTHGRACWLHSHPHVYPLRYPDKRGSSHQQQVTCYSFKDVNNWWIVKRPKKNDLVVSEPVDKIRHGDIIQLVHGMTSRALNSHDVAAPMSPQHQEVSCYIDYNISFPAQNLWKVEIVNKDTEGAVWHTIHSHVRLIHVNSTQALKFSGKQLPEWGFNQHEVVTDRVIKQDDTVWNVEEHRYTKNADQKEREREMGMAEFVPLQPTQLSFFEKIWELQVKMLTVNQENVQDHMYSSEPMEWPFLSRGIAYWISPHSNAQIHLIGNVVIWYSATVGMFVYLAIFLFYILRRRRACYDIPEDTWEKFCVIGKLFLIGYLLHFLPYFFADRTLFLHHYLPAFLYKLLLLVGLIEHVIFLFNYTVKSRMLRRLFYISIFAWLLGALFVFWNFSVFSYGRTPLSAQQVMDLKWKDTWDFIIHRT
ncbi:protein O-mannosyl-transferase 1-like [Limulus polyphemus]|uniref:dolichyl-phosphate-mannose--protein mannosyltransferase n=1 Tax=Limulus polyphemus TaxID=6850 RepID=A0ABM1C489_LIMPO|nr:protein O-mannosyl-transferase 1-like [Limulus polyphemus]